MSHPSPGVPAIKSIVPAGARRGSRWEQTHQLTGLQVEERPSTHLIFLLIKNQIEFCWHWWTGIYIHYESFKIINKVKTMSTAVHLNDLCWISGVLSLTVYVSFELMWNLSIHWNIWNRHFRDHSIGNFIWLVQFNNSSGKLFWAPVPCSFRVSMASFRDEISAASLPLQAVRLSQLSARAWLRPGLPPKLTTWHSAEPCGMGASVQH